MAEEAGKMIDAHCHLDDKAFVLDLKSALERAEEWKIKSIVTSASSFSSNEKTLAIASENKNVLACCALDPVHCLRENKTDETITLIREHEKEITAIGEVGIDYYWEKKPEEQTENFKKFIELAEELGKPLVVHARNSMDDVLKALGRTTAPVMIHCFSGGKEHAKACVDRGYFMSFATSACFLPDRKSLIKLVPLENMLAETDSPFNHPQRAGRNEPANVRFAYDLIADMKAAEFAEIERAIDGNAERFFKTRF
ncbi:TatD family hydrolase [Candidatus Micrarchaeota archaeon]|nr:TatD family hydrolase [Candidatus Micrarchaeota archaeon]